MILCLKKSSIVSLPDQMEICSKPGTACRYVEVRTSFSNWEKRLAFFTQDESGTTKIIIYKEPLCGNIYVLQNATKFEVKKDANNKYFFKIRTGKTKLEMKFDGKEAALWAAAIISADFSNVSHLTHKSTLQNVTGETGASQCTGNKDVHFELKDKSEEVYTGTRRGYVKNQKEDQEKAQNVETKNSDRKGKDTPQSRKSHESKTRSDGKKKSRTPSEEKKFKLMKTQTLSAHTETAPSKQLEPAVFEDNTVVDADPKLIPEAKNSDVDVTENDEKKKGPDGTPVKPRLKNSDPNKTDGKTQSDEGSVPNVKTQGKT